MPVMVSVVNDISNLACVAVEDFGGIDEAGAPAAFEQQKPDSFKPHYSVYITVTALQPCAAALLCAALVKHHHRPLVTLIDARCNTVCIQAYE